MTFMDRKTGKLLTGIEELRASILEIVITPIGSVPLNRPFGSGVFQMIDAPQNRELALKAKILDAVDRLEPRVKVYRVMTQYGGRSGEIKMAIYFTDLLTGLKDVVEVDVGNRP